MLLHYNLLASHYIHALGEAHEAVALHKSREDACAADAVYVNLLCL